MKQPHARIESQESATILIVDDNEMNRDVLSRRMGRAGYRTVLAAGGRQALQAIENGGIDLVLLDIEMPQMSGLEVLGRLRQTVGPAELPVIMVTARTDSDMVVEALNCGANDYVTKPVDMPVALARVRTQLSLKRAEDAVRISEERYALAARGANDGLWDWDLLQDEVYFSPRWFSIVGLEGTLQGNTLEAWLGRVHPVDLDALKQALDAHVKGQTEHFESEHRLLHGDQTYRWVLCRGLAVRDASMRATRMAGSLTDVTATKVIDPLTKLPNRLLLDDRLELAIARAKRHPESRFAVLLLDMDRFKDLNESLGLSVGDQLLAAIAERLGRHVRATDTLATAGRSDTIARLRGDEFVVVLEDIQHDGGAEIVARRFLEDLSRPFEIDGHEVFMRASAGVVNCSGEDRCAADVLRDADTALHRAKLLGGGQHAVFEASMREDAVERLELENGLRHAIERDELRVHYQPIVNLADGLILGFEALVRWEHPSRGLISPADFIPIAEETGLIVPLGRWVLGEACRQAGEWNVTYQAEPRKLISVNLSAKQMLEADLVDQVREALTTADLDPRALKLEITESIVVENVEGVVGKLEQLRKLGVEIAIDDFGTGFSSFAYLQDLPVDRVKIDRSFVCRIDSHRDTLQIVRAIVEMAQQLDMGIIAEGVETSEQAALLIELGCKLCQGFLYSKPVDAGAAAELLERGRIVLEQAEVAEKV